MNKITARLVSTPVRISGIGHDPESSLKEYDSRVTYRSAPMVIPLLLACGSSSPSDLPSEEATLPDGPDVVTESAGDSHEEARDLDPREHDRRGDDRLFAGRFSEAILDYDCYLKAFPDAEPYHWRRGIAFYYAGRYAEGVAQFEVHRTVNPADVENAAWHFLCKARLDGPDAAREALLPVRPDGRVPMMKVYDLFAGQATPEDVLAAGDVSADGRFYAHLYVGLFYEATGDTAAAKHHIDLAATRYGRPHYMGEVARTHAALLTD